MEEDEHPPIPIGSLTSSEATKEHHETSQHTKAMEEDEKTVIEIGSSEFTSSPEAPSATSSSSTSSSSSSSSLSSRDESSKESSTSIATQDLVNRLKTNTGKITKNPPPLEEPSGAYQASADLQPKGNNSGTRRSHPISLEPSGVAGDLNKDASHGA
jgi:hypothetical protein